MSDAQAKAASSTKTNLLVIAPPGCGKTELLAMRADFLIGQLRSHQTILALTFSNKARDNLSERLRGVLGSERFRRFIRVSNFHGHATEIIRAHGRTLGIDPNFAMPTRQTLNEAIRAKVQGLSQREAYDEKDAIEEALGSSKREPLDDDQIWAALKNIGNNNALSIECDRREAGMLHYDDLLRHAQRLLKVPKVANLYQQHYGAVLVDEFQDLSPQQLEIALLSCTTNRTFVGDPLQGIYTWAGARPAEVQQELREICGDPLELNLCYRSSPAVLAVVGSVSSLMGGPQLEAAQPDKWNDGGAAAAITHLTGVQEGQWIAQSAVRIMARDPEATIGVITRAGWRRAPIDKVFAGTNDVPCMRWDLAIDDPAILERLRLAARGLPKSVDLMTLQLKVTADIDPTDVDTHGQVIDAIELLREIAEQASSLTAALSQFKVRDDDRAITPGVHLLNAHTGKGQQFDWVFVPGFEDFHIPNGRAKTEAEIDEEQRTLLVMLSRARHGVVISRASQLISRKGKPYSTGLSQWWSGVAAACTLDQAAFQAHLETYVRMI
ncbi:MAG: ATP-dependent helicase [Acidobacteria bacterium]|nr:ATP-dependent helicase [Acidobacteriota bacterium]